MDCWWVGTDTLLLVDMPKQLRTIQKLHAYKRRFIARIFDHYCTRHHAVSQLQADELKKFGVKKPIVITPFNLQHPEPVKKVRHSKFTILFYFYKWDKKDMPFKKWLYGYDLVERLMDEVYDGVRYLISDGESLTADEMFSETDFCIRPNRHDGVSRIIRECEINNIPYYHSQTNPNYEAMKDAVLKAKEQFYNVSFPVG